MNTRDRLIENAGTTLETVTVYFGDRVEIRNFGEGASEEMVTYLADGVRLVNGVAGYLYRDQLDSVRMITDNSGNRPSGSISSLR